MNFHDLSAHFSGNTRNMTYECKPELVVTVPAGCSSTAKDDKTTHLKTSQSSHLAGVSLNFTTLCVTFP